MQAASSVTISGQLVNTVYGFAGTVTEMVKVMDVTASDFDTTTTVNVISHKGATAPATCAVTYTPAALNVAPRYVFDPSGC
jgi:hypothetical protein